MVGFDLIVFSNNPLKMIFMGAVVASGFLKDKDANSLVDIRTKLGALKF